MVDREELTGRAEVSHAEERVGPPTRPESKPPTPTVEQTEAKSMFPSTSAVAMQSGEVMSEVNDNVLWSDMVSNVDFTANDSLSDEGVFSGR
ncbi:hypothetical protein KOW79_002986 [Hemibagrus wyckioides]|uniref:Uncharacterized protein n=1 Tax=Hemibagrus wyckioides TaxID=337641 RepID=A0A9D3P2E0_9TELE|nr:hypothetical protein KOW79_002986 [Hemibagrus wyckioides]